MTQQEISIQWSELVWRYCNREYRSPWELQSKVDVILFARGIMPNLPMYATARLIVTRDVINQLEGNAYNTPAEL